MISLVMIPENKHAEFNYLTFSPYRPLMPGRRIALLGSKTGISKTIKCPGPING
jgi:hypothetical protein